MDIPVKRLVFSETPGESGVKAIAFVDAPAIMVNWVAFKDQKEIKYAVQDEAKRIILSPALIPDFLIPRIDEITKQPFAVVMDRETIFEVAMRWQQEGRASKANEMHHSSQELEGITWFGAFVSDEKHLPNPPAFSDLPPGTWFVMGKVDNEEVWNKIQTGQYKGISIEGFFDMEQAESLDDQQIQAIIQNILD